MVPPAFGPVVTSFPPRKPPNIHTSAMINQMADTAEIMERTIMSKRSRFHRIQMPSGGKTTSSTHISHSFSYK